MPVQEKARDTLASWYALFVLTLVSLFAILDRPVLVLQAETIRQAIGLSDTQLGLLQGTGVALFAGVASYPLAWLADRFDRRVVLSACLFIGSLAVVGAAFSENFIQLFLANALGGAGEAALVPIVLSLIPMIFSKVRRQLANSIYLLATAAGGSVAMIAAGQLIGAVDNIRPVLPGFMSELESWRISFLLAAAGVPVMIGLLLTISLPLRGEATEAEPDSRKPKEPPPEILSFLRRHPRGFGGLYLAIGLSNCGFTAISAWLVVILMRLFGETPEQVGAAMGLAGLLALPVGFVLSVFLGRIFRRGGVTRMPVIFMQGSWLLSALLLAGMALATSAGFIYLAAFFIYVTLVTCGMFYPTIMQAISPEPLRARIMALQVVVIAFCVALAPVLVGLLSDAAGDHPRSLLYAALSVAVPLLIIATLILRSAQSSLAEIEAEVGAAPAAAPHTDDLASLTSPV